MDRILLKAMSIDADLRYRSMDNFAQALQAPSLTAYSDPTIVNSGNGVSFDYTQGVISQVQSPSQVNGSQSVPQPLQTPIPSYQYVYPQPAAYPVLPVNSGTSKQSKPTKPIPEYRPLPRPFSQGCLWGLIQGLLAALIVLVMKKEVYFYVAVVEGFLFFMLAGFLTTRKGGKSFRAVWAGFWAGTVSTIMFWIVVAVGFAVLVSQNIALQTARAQRNGILQNPGQVLHNAITVVGATLPVHPATAQAGSNVVVFLVGGLLCAIIFSLIGGIFGTSRFRTKMRRRGYP
jgi:hypothetical protein